MKQFLGIFPLITAFVFAASANAADSCRWLYNIPDTDFWYCNGGHKTIHYRQNPKTYMTKYDAEIFMAAWTKQHPGRTEAHFKTTKFGFEPIPMMYENQNWPMIYGQ